MISTCTDLSRVIKNRCVGLVVAIKPPARDSGIFNRARMKSTRAYMARVAKVGSITLTIAVIAPASDSIFDKGATMESATFNLLRGS